MDDKELNANFEYRCTECGKLHKNGEECSEVKDDLAKARLDGERTGEDRGFAIGWKQAMVSVEGNGCSKSGMITIPISLLHLLSKKYPIKPVKKVEDEN